MIIGTIISILFIIIFIVMILFHITVISMLDVRLISFPPIITICKFPEKFDSSFWLRQKVLGPEKGSNRVQRTTLPSKKKSEAAAYVRERGRERKRDTTGSKDTKNAMWNTKNREIN